MTTHTLPYKTVSLRLMFEEDAPIKAGAKALAVDVGPLLYTAALGAAHRLGFYEGMDSHVRLKPTFVWKDAPERPENESAKVRLTISVHPLHFEAISRAAEAVRASVPLFLIGATLRFLADAKAANAREARADKKKLNERLAALELPQQYKEA